MDKLITAVIIIAVAYFFYWLHGMGGAGDAWMATVGVGEQAHSMGPYASRDACAAAVREAAGSAAVPYSCTLRPAGY